MTVRGADQAAQACRPGARERDLGRPPSRRDGRPVYQSEIELTLAMRDEHHCSVLLETLRSLGYQVERLR
jgi:hypothetical protein